MSATVHFTSSSTFMENESEPNACENAEIEVTDYIEGTYDLLRSGPDGRVIAEFVDDAWELSDGRRFSDWAVGVA